ncbi:MAG: FecR family protein, partial [Gemmatimonadaceae bacterium]
MSVRAARPKASFDGMGQRRQRLAFPIAAMIVVAIGSVLVWRTVSSPNAVARGGAPVMHTVSTERGERAELRLGDGTRVVLAAVSTLRYPADFGARSREVHLEGEAYFDVVHDARNPFVVRAGSAIAEDLGTAFIVRAYPNDPDAEVIVTSGKVALRAAEAGAPRGPVLTRGQLGRLTRDDNAVKVETVDVDDYVGWTEGRFVFDGEPLSEVIIRLERWYDVVFRFGDSTLASHRITASFKDKTIAEVLD